MRSLFKILSLCVLANAVGMACNGADPPADSDAFETHIRPILAAKCVKCHGATKQEGKLRLDSRAGMLVGGESGPAIVAGQPNDSLLVAAIRYESFEMPPTGKLPESDIERLANWIRAGADWPDHVATIREPSRGVTESDREWWAFRPLHRAGIPVDDHDPWSRNQVDRFVLQRLAEHDMVPGPRADKVTLVRRLYFDLIGVPPTPIEIDAFVNDSSETAWESLIDQLLDDSRYGEHWARYWLDVVRYAESDGWNQDAFRGNIWRFRDYVVNSFNSDKPWPQFVREQLAGDEIPDASPEQRAAAGFLRLGIYEYNQRDARSHWDDIMNEMTDVAGDVFLGLGMACARCHDHKFDPILQRDYFQLRAFFEPVVWRDDLTFSTARQQQEYADKLAVWERQTDEIRGRIDALVKPYHDRKWKSTVDKFPLDIQACFYKPIGERTSWEHQMAYLVSRQFEEEGGGPLSDMKKDVKQQYDALQKELSAFDAIKPNTPQMLMTATDFAGTPAPTSIPERPNETPVSAGFPTVLCQSEADVPRLPEIPASTGRRTALAEWIGRSDNPLTSRVIVNRIWQQHFGQGLVASASDFGHLGQLPTHPDLLDWLTLTFIENGMRFKDLHRLILRSAVWQQSAQHPDAEVYQARDPEDALLWRSRVRRLSAEQIRDAMLMASGELQQKLGGPSVDAKSSRRSLYVKSFRNTPDDFLHAFDVANGLKSVAQRNATTTPTQSLLLINGDYTLARARKMAQRIQPSADDSPDETLNQMFRRTWGRRPADAERSAALQFLGLPTALPVAEDLAGVGPIDPEKLVDLCHILLNSNEFLYVD